MAEPYQTSVSGSLHPGRSAARPINPTCHAGSPARPPHASLSRRPRWRRPPCRTHHPGWSPMPPLCPHAHRIGLLMTMAVTHPSLPGRIPPSGSVVFQTPTQPLLIIVCNCRFSRDSIFLLQWSELGRVMWFEQWCSQPIHTRFHHWTFLGRVPLVLAFWLIVTCALTKLYGLGFLWGVLHVVMQSQQWYCECLPQKPLSWAPTLPMVLTIAFTGFVFHIPHQICSHTSHLLHWNQLKYCLVLSAAIVHSLLPNWCDYNSHVLAGGALYLVKFIAVLWMYCLFEFCNRGSDVTPMCTHYLLRNFNKFTMLLIASRYITSTRLRVTTTSTGSSMAANVLNSSTKL